MNPELPDTAVEFGATARRALAALGGVDAARRAEEDPARRRGEVADALRSLGIDELDPRADADSRAAAAALCEEAGRGVLPYPIASVLLGREGTPFAVVPADRPRVDHGDLFEQWRVATLAGHTHDAEPKGGALGSRLGPFVADLVATGDLGGEAPAQHDVAVHLTLTSWQVLGTIDRAVELAVDHVTNRIQFGKPIAAFQAVQFQLADAAVAVAGLRELAHFTLWRVGELTDAAMVDVLALRVHAIDVAHSVLRSCQQLHGAAGVCDEYDISVLARHVQPLLRLPFGAERTADELAGAISRSGFDGLFAHGGAIG